MNFVFFSDTDIAECHYQGLLQSFVRDGQVYYVGKFYKEETIRDIECISLRSVLELDPEQTVAFVCNPLWLPMLFKFRPKFLIFSFSRENTADHITLKCATLLSAMANLVVTSSERIYLEQTLRLGNVLLWHSENERLFDVIHLATDSILLRDYEVFTRTAMLRMLHQQDFDDIQKIQWRSRDAYYTQLSEQYPYNETIRFLLASYKYLLYDTSAELHLLNSFQLMLNEAYHDCLQGQYRFLSAIQAQKSELEEAVHTYGITALDEHERTQYDNLLSLLESGHMEIATAEIYRLNDDLRQAAKCLRQIDSDESRSLYLRLLLHQWKVKPAIEFVSHNYLQSLIAPRDHFVLDGLAKWMDGQPHLAIRSWLRAADDDSRMVGQIVEFKTINDRADLFQGALGHGY